MTTLTLEYGLILQAPDCSNDPNYLFSVWQSQIIDNSGFGSNWSPINPILIDDNIE